MPWFPDFLGAAELARRQGRAAGHADPVGRYLAALNSGRTQPLEDVWPAEVVVFDPRAGTVRGHRQLRQFVKRSKALLADRHARTEDVATTVVGNRVVVELLGHLIYEGQEVDWPIAVVADSPDDRSVVFRTYLSERVIDGQQHLRAPILPVDDVPLADIVTTYQAALASGDVDGVVNTFTPDGYLREPLGGKHVHRGCTELRTFFREAFRHDGGISLDTCAVTDDGVRCAVEYNRISRSSRGPAPQAGIAVYERGADGLLAAIRVYDDVEVGG